MALDDLLSWRHLYLAGRLHKPVGAIRNDGEISSAISTNLKSALCAALLLCREKVSILELLHEIASLSYRGDLRMRFAEDPLKILKIISLSSFQNEQKQRFDKAERENSSCSIYEILEETPLGALYTDPLRQLDIDRHITVVNSHSSGANMPPSYDHPILDFLSSYSVIQPKTLEYKMKLSQHLPSGLLSRNPPSSVHFRDKLSSGISRASCITNILPFLEIF